VRPAYLVAALGLAACTEPAIEMAVVLPSATATQGFDLSCVGAVAVRVIGNDIGDASRQADELADCVDLTTPPSTFGDVQRAIHGRFAFALPRSGLAGVQLSGFKGSCSDRVGSHEAVFFGGAPRGGSDTMTIPLIPNISCDRAKAYDVTVVDLVALTSTHECDSPIDVSTVFAGDLHPRLLGDRMPRMELEHGVSAVNALDGTGRVQSYAATASSRSCIAIGDRGVVSGGVSCVNAAAPTLCGDPGELEVAALPLSLTAASRDAALIAQYGEPVFGAVWEPSLIGADHAISGATVELADPSQGTVVYVQRGTGTLDPIASARATGTDGLFIAYLRGEPTSLIVKAPGHVQETLQVASSPDWPSTVLAVLATQ